MASQTDSVLKGVAAAASAYLFAKGAHASRSVQWGLSTAAGAMVYAWVEQQRKAHDAAVYAAADQAPPSPGASQYGRWRV